MTSATVDLDRKDVNKRSFAERFWDWLNQVQFVVYTLLVVCLLAIGFLWQRMFIVVPPGHLGVMYRTVYGGTVTNRTWEEGLHVIPPWDKLTIYDVRLQQKTLDFKVLSDEGLALGVEVVVRYRPYEEMLGYLQKDIGADYFQSLIKPEIESHIRRTFGGRPAHEVYASARDVLQEVGQFPLIGRLGKSGGEPQASRPYVQVQELKLTQIELPQVVENAIVEKYRQEQLMLAYRYKLEREVKEAERKRTEAAGIRDFNLIAGKVSPDMLRWRSIDATLELAKSNNSKVVVLGSPQGGMTMQLNLGDNPNSPAAPTPDAPEETPRLGKKLTNKPSPPSPTAPKPADAASTTPAGEMEHRAQDDKAAVLKGAAAVVAAAVSEVKAVARAKASSSPAAEQTLRPPYKYDSAREPADDREPDDAPRTMAGRDPSSDPSLRPKVR